MLINGEVLTQKWLCSSLLPCWLGKHYCRHKWSYCRQLCRQACSSNHQIVFWISFWLSIIWTKNQFFTIFCCLIQGHILVSSSSSRAKSISSDHSTKMAMTQHLQPPLHCELLSAFVWEANLSSLSTVNTKSKLALHLLHRHLKWLPLVRTSLPEYWIFII